MGKTQKLSLQDRKDLREVKRENLILTQKKNTEIIPDAYHPTPGTKHREQIACFNVKQQTIKKEPCLAGIQERKPQASLDHFFQNGPPSQVRPNTLRSEKYLLAISKRNAHRKAHARQGTQKTLYGIQAAKAYQKKKNLTLTK